MVATEACNRATCDSSAMVTWSRNRRWTRMLTTLRNHVAVAATPMPTAAASTSRRSPASTPSASSLSKSASSASGTAGGKSSREDIAVHPFLSQGAGRTEARGLQVEHGSVAAAGGHQLIVRAQLDHPATLEHADAISVAHGREAVRDEDRRGVARRGEDAVENLGLAAHVELRG